MTFSTWIKRDRTDAPQHETIVGYADEDGYNNYFGLMIDFENRLKYTVRRSSSRDDCRYFGPTPLESGRWYHVAVAATDSSVVGYINGVPEVFTRDPDSECPRVYGIPDVSAQAENASIGNLNRSVAYQCDYFMGKMDEVMIFDKTLSAEECIQLYEGSLNGLVAHWKFDEGSGMIAHDSAGDNDGVVYGAQWTTGEVGGALDFDGIDGYVEIPDDDSLTPNAEITIAYWVYKTGSSHAGVYKYAECVTEPASPGSSRAYVLQVLGNSDTAFLRVFSDWNTYDDIEGDTIVSKNEWHHIAGTFDSGNAAVYVDGQLDGSTAMSVTSIMNDVQPLTIGAFWSYCGVDSLVATLRGKIDDVRIYDRALSAQEIEELYGQPLMPDVYHVDADNGDDDNEGLTPQTAFATIQKGIDSAKDEDTVIVADGTYVGPGNRDLDFGGRAITVRSLNGPHLTIIDCENLGRGFYFHGNEDADSVVEGFTITNGLADEGGGVYCSSSPTIYNCIIKRNRAQNGGGLAVRDSADPIVANCIIAENSCAGAGGGGIDCSGAGSMIINCTIGHNSSNGEAGGILCTGDSNPIVTNCILWADLPSEIYLGEGASAFVTYCDIQGGWPGEGNIDADPCFVPPEYLGPICYWKFDEGSGTTAHDSAGDNDGVVYGAEWTTGQVGGALSFDGVDDYVALPDNNPVWLPRQNFALSVWAYFDGDPGSDTELMLDLNFADSATSSNEVGYSLQRHPACGGCAAFSMTTTTNSDEVLLSDELLVKGRWYHVVAVRDGTTQAIYIDGRLDTSRTCSPHPIDFVGGYDDDKVNIGAYSTSPAGRSKYLNGAIDDARIYDRALSAGEIERFYQNRQGESTDYHLLPGSPCIDAGTDAGVYTDIEGNARPFDYPGIDNNGDLPDFDMGAYEAIVTTIVEAQVRFTPQTLNPKSRGKWFKAHVVLPAECSPEDLDVDTPAVLTPCGVESERMNVIVDNDGFVRIEITFDRSTFFDALTSCGTLDLTITGSLTDNRYFAGTDTVSILAGDLKCIGILASNWLKAHCDAPDSCSGLDLDNNSMIDFKDFAILSGSTPNSE